MKTYEPIDGEKAFEGELTSFDGEIATVTVKIKTRKKKWCFLRKTLLSTSNILM